MFAISFASPDGVVAEGAADGHGRLERFLSELSTLTANFEQQLFDEYGELLETSRGAVAISKPGKFRWEYREPYSQLIVTDGTTLWVYDADLEQVSINPLENGGAGSPAELLVGDVDLDSHYDIVESAVEDDVAWVALTPREAASQYSTIEIGLDDDGIRGMKLRDNLNQLTAVRFQDVARNTGIEDEQFNFVAPPGVDVVTGSGN